ncbi:MAG: hypothetical protein NTX31_03835 [Burkholderiales bacterium]|nr:hypothetical protein [Burkholderiales bacterium]
MYSNLNYEQSTSAVNLMAYGINTIVLTAHSQLEKIGDKIENSNDSQWSNGKGKIHFCKSLKKHLIKEDVYFTNHRSKALRTNERWMKFCDDCVAFSVMFSRLHHTPVMLVHPQQYEEMIAHSLVNATCGNLPSLIDGVDILWKH